MQEPIKAENLLEHLIRSSALLLILNKAVVGRCSQVLKIHEEHTRTNVHNVNQPEALTGDAVKTPDAKGQ